MQKRQLELLIKGLIYATFFVPLVVIPSSFIFPFIVPKILTFRSLVEVMLCAYILLLIINWQEYKPKLTALNLAVGAFLLSFAISTFVGADPYHSFWDNHERMLGLFTIIHFVIYYFICTSVFKNWNDWKWALRMFLLGGSVVMFIGMLQAWVDPNLLLNQGNATRVSSTLGNPIYVGGYGLFLTLVSYLLFIREKNPVWRWVLGVLAILSILGLFYSGTRGSMLGLVAGFGTAIVGYIIVLKDHQKIRYSLVGLAILGVVVISFLYVFRKTEFVMKIPAVGRAINTSLSDIEASPRWIAWQIAIESWKDKPIFGWGPNNYFYAFNLHYNPKSLNFGYGETWFDNAHNIIVNTLAVQGAFGIVIYLGMFAVGVVSLTLAWNKNQLNIHVAVIGSAFLIAHLVGNVTVFENPTSYLYFMFWLALANAMSVAVVIPTDPAKAGERRNPLNIPNSRQAKMGILSGDRNISGGLMVSLGVVACLLIFIFNIQPARANMMTLDAIRYLSQDPVLGVPAMKDALGFQSPHIDDIRSDIGRTATQLLSDGYQKLGKERSQEIFNIVYTELQKNLILHPMDIRNQITLAQLGQMGFVIASNPQYVLDAERFLSDALVKSPHIDDIRSDIGRTATQLLSDGYQKLGKERSQEIFNIVYTELQKNLILHPMDIRNQITLAQLGQMGFVIASNPQYVLDAERFLSDALVKSPRRQQIIYSLSGVKMQLNKSAEVIALLEQTIADNSSVGESYWRLAYTYKYMGKMDKAREILDLAAKNSVVFSDSEKQIISQILAPQPATTLKK